MENDNIDKKICNFDGSFQILGKIWRIQRKIVKNFEENLGKIAEKFSKTFTKFCDALINFYGDLNENIWRF